MQAVEAAEAAKAAGIPTARAHAAERGQLEPRRDSRHASSRRCGSRESSEETHRAGTRSRTRPAGTAARLAARKAGDVSEAARAAGIPTARAHAAERGQLGPR